MSLCLHPTSYLPRHLYVNPHLTYPMETIYLSPLLWANRLGPNFTPISLPPLNWVISGIAAQYCTSPPIVHYAPYGFKIGESFGNTRQQPICQRNLRDGTAQDGGNYSQAKPPAGITPHLMEHFAQHLILPEQPVIF